MSDKTGRINGTLFKDYHQLKKKINRKWNLKNKNFIVFLKVHLRPKKSSI